MLSYGKMAAVGDADLLFGLRALGIRVHSLRDASEAGRLLETLRKDQIVLCLVHQDWLSALSEAKEAALGKPGPVLVGFSDYRTLLANVEKLIREMAVRATGSDALIKRKDKDESS